MIAESGNTVFGGVAHLGERLNGIQKVVGSIPIISTSGRAPHPISKSDRVFYGGYLAEMNKRRF